MNHLQSDVLNPSPAPGLRSISATCNSVQWTGAAAIIDEARNGRLFVLVDDCGSTATASLMVPAQMATPAAINFMATHGRGLICLALEKRRISQLGLPLQTRRHADACVEQFTVSIEASDGVSTGISTHDRAKTIATAIDESSAPGGIVTPGHVFPIVAREGGVLARAGHAEAVVDVARLAGLNSSGVICTILGPDGEIAAFDHLESLAQAHDLRIGLMSDLVAYRCRHDPQLQHCGVAPLATNIAGAWQLHRFRDRLGGAEVIALHSGKAVPGQPVLACLSTVSILANVPGQGDAETDRLRDFMGYVGGGQAGVVILQQPEAASGPGLVQGGQATEARQVAASAQVLAQMAITAVSLVDGSEQQCAALASYGIRARTTDLATLRGPASAFPSAVAAR